MAGVEMELAGEPGDGHRRLPLAVDLDELRPERGERPPGVLDVHGPAAVDDGLQVVAVHIRDAPRFEEAGDHRRCEEEARPRVVFQEVDDLLGMEPAALRNDLHRPPCDVGEGVAAGGMRHRGGMDDAVVLGHRIDIAEIVHGLRDEVPVGEGGALRPAGGAARVEQPRGIGGIAVREGKRFAREELPPPRGVIGPHQVLERGDLPVEAGQALAERAVREAGPGAGVLEDVRELAPVELRVHRDRAHVRVPAAEEGDHELGGVGHRDPAPVARPQIEALDETAGEPGRGLRELGVGGDGLDAADEGRPSGVADGGLGEERARVHCLSLPSRGAKAPFERKVAAPRNQRECGASRGRGEPTVAAAGPVPPMARFCDDRSIGRSRLPAPRRGLSSGRAFGPGPASTSLAGSGARRFEEPYPLRPAAAAVDAAGAAGHRARAHAPAPRAARAPGRGPPGRRAARALKRFPPTTTARL